ncbi:MAG: hypothetical protein BWY67_01136 [Bacteroidetes bacterium ADurb.Bin397]|nr:MAG: hypothetical protein BWY67_01136 [Bacteroidetes bacterium ADurb.Bin397]
MAVAAGVAITVLPDVVFKSLDAAQLYAVAPVAVSVVLSPAQIVVLPETEIAGRAFTVKVAGTLELTQVTVGVVISQS